MDPKTEASVLAPPPAEPTSPPAVSAAILPPPPLRDVATTLGQMAELPSRQVNKEKGDAFECFVVKGFEKKYFTLKHWRSDKGVPGRYAESNQHPDLEWEFHHAGMRVPFAVECKWRQTAFRESVQWAKERQMQTYRDYAAQQNFPVFVILGLGGVPGRPDSVYVIPLERLTTCSVSLKWLQCFKRKDAARRFFFDAAKYSLS